MDFNTSRSNSFRRSNQQIVARDEDCKVFIDEMREVGIFLRDFAFLSGDQDLFLCGRRVISPHLVLTSSELTVGSIIACCESGCIADAYTLLRKYRDDLFFYLYVVAHETCRKCHGKLPIVERMGRQIEKWVTNDLEKLNIGAVFSDISKVPQVKAAVQRYDLKPSFDKLGKKLNKYVHGNVIAYYNRVLCAHQGESINTQIGSLCSDMQFITVTFLFLLTLCSPMHVKSSDYGDYLDAGVHPPDNSQYWVAPFVEEFIKKNNALIDERCAQYLRDNTGMEFD